LALAAGKLADCIAVDGDPLANPALLDDPTRIVLVIKGGQVMKDSIANRSEQRAPAPARREAATAVH